MFSTRSPRSRLKRRLLGIGGLLVVGGIAGGIAFYLAFLVDLPDIATVEDYHPPLASVVLDRNGRRIGEFYTERRRLVPLSEVPQHVIRAFVAAEDSNFFEHSGIDYVSILRAAWANLRAGGEIVQGASTITQQTVKGLLLSPERNIRRKVREIILARDLEQRLTKQEILYLYLNQIYLGQGAYGIGEAAHTYFGKDVSELTVSEAAQLAGLPKAPSTYSPRTHPKLAEMRRRYVLGRMRDEGFIDTATYQQAMAEPPKLTDEPWRKDFEASAYFVEEVRRYLVDQLGSDAVLNGGLVIETTLDAGLERSARRALRHGLEALDRRQGYRGPERRVDPPDVPATLVELAEKNGLTEPAKDETEGAAGEAPEAGETPSAAVAGEAGETPSAATAEEAGETPSAAAAGKDAGGATGAPQADERARLRALLAQGPLHGLVMDVDSKDQTATIAFGPRASGVVHLEDVRWAHAPDPHRRLPPVDKIEEVFHPGDVARFEAAPTDGKPAQKPDAGADSEPVRLALYQEPTVQGGLLSFDLDSGDVVALVGGYDFAKSQFDRVTQARRQPGSAFKPMVYGTALSLTDAAGHKLYTPASIIQDRPKVYTDQTTGFLWKPKNYERAFLGPITLRTALAHSVNTAAVHLCDDVGVGNVVRYARRLGIESPLEPSLALALGTSGVSLLELTRAYAVFPAGGRRVVPRFIRRVLDRDGNVLLENVALGNSFENQAEPKAPGADVATAPQEGNAPPAGPGSTEPGTEPGSDQLIPQADAYLMTDMLRAVVLEGTGRRVAAALDRPLGGKTGTTNDQADAWFVGFSPEIATGVWVGHDETRYLGPGETGAHAAAPIWIDYMRAALAGVPKRDFKPPPSIVFARIDRETGLLATHQSKDTVFQAFIAGTEPTETADTQRAADDALRDLREDSLSKDRAVQLMRLEGF